MEINREKDGDKLILRLSGRLDSTTSPELSKVVDKELGEVQDLRLDLEKLDYISSAGLRVLLAAYKKMQAADGRMTVCNTGENVREVFKITGFDRTLGLK